jgi:MFS family permease
MTNSQNKIAIFFRYKEFAVLSVIAVVQGALAGAIAPVFPLWLRDHFDTSLQDIFYIVALIGLGSSIANIAIGRTTDKLGKRKTIFIIMLSLCAVRNYLFAFFPNMILVIATLWVTQLSTSAVIFSILNDKIKKEDAAKKLELTPEYINTIIRISVSVGFSIGAPLGLAIVSAASYQWFYLWYGTMYIFAIALVFFLIKDDGIIPKKERQKQPLKSIISNFNMALLIFVMLFFLFSGNQSMNTIFSLFVTDTYTLNMLGILVAYSVAFEIPFFLVAAKLIERFGSYKVMLLAAVVCAAYFVLLMLSTHLAILFVAQILGAFVTSLMFLSTMTYVQGLFKEQVGFANFFYFTSVMMVAILGNALVGRLMVFGFSTVFGILASFVAASIVVSYFVNRYVSMRPATN